VKKLLKTIVSMFRQKPKEVKNHEKQVPRTSIIKDRVEAWYRLSYEEKLKKHEQVKEKIPADIRGSAYHYIQQLSQEECLELLDASKAEIYEAMVCDGWIKPSNRQATHSFW
jgi:phage portal protein BeeE